MHNYADQIDWDDYRIALEIARQGSFLKAADYLNIHHTTVARRLERLEKNLSTQLFYRHSRGVELTLAGEEMLAVLAVIHEDLSRLGARMQGYDARLTGSIKITTLETFHDLFVPFMWEFQTLYPEIHFDIILEARSLNLGQGEADIAFRGNPNAGQDEDLIPIKLTDIYMALYGSPDYFERHPAIERLDDLAAQHFVIVKEPPASFGWERWLHQQITAPQIGLTLNSPAGTLAAVKAGFGLGFIFCSQAAADPNLRLAWPAQDDWTS